MILTRFFFSFSLGEKDSSVRAPLLDLWIYLRGKLLLALQMFYVTVVSVFLELVRVHYCQKYLGFSCSLRKFNLKIFWFSSPCKDTVCVSIYINVVCVCDIMKYLGFFSVNGGEKCALRGVSSFLTFVSNSILPK